MVRTWQRRKEKRRYDEEYQYFISSHIFTPDASDFFPMKKRENGYSL
jgi:hypothetical protein